MPRFLNTSTGEFEWHNSPQYVRYAILSHTWQFPENGGEQSYEDVRDIQATVDRNLRQLQVAVVGELKVLFSLGQPLPGPIKMASRTSHSTSIALEPGPLTILSQPKLCEKIRRICKVARSAGYRLLWIDSSCIDKSSSAELSEAINSMYDLYRLADICYVYLEDLPDGDDPTLWKSKFHACKWHKRGWTLQELLAPGTVVFLNKSWRFLGTKMGLASTLEKITNIPVHILTGEAPITSVSVARRMSWAAGRNTTRIEDEAYSLMGIFEVHMSPIYGEGKNAFLRLQEEIIRTIPDQSLFAWGDSCTLVSLRQGLRRSMEYDPYFSTDSDSGLLASSPRNFKDTGDIAFLTPADLASRLGLQKEDIPSLHCVFTPQGVRIQLLFVDLAQIPQVFDAFFTSVGTDLCEDCMRAGHAHTLAFLQCEDKTGSLIALPLRSPRAGVERGEGAIVATHVGCQCDWPFKHNPWYHFVRMRKEALAEALPFLSSAPAQLSILHHYRSPMTSKAHVFRYIGDFMLWSNDYADGVTISLAPGCIEALGVLGLAATPMQCEFSEGEIIMSISLVSEPQPHSPPTAISQTIDVRVVLRKRHLRFPDTEACFFVSNSFSVASPIPNPSTENDARTLSARPTSSTPASLVPKNASRVRREQHSRSVTLSFSGVYCQTLVDTSFVLHASPDQDHEHKSFVLRLLKLSLDRSPHPFSSFNTIWLSIELSDKYSPSKL